MSTVHTSWLMMSVVDCKAQDGTMTDNGVYCNAHLSAALKLKSQLSHSRRAAVPSLKSIHNSHYKSVDSARLSVDNAGCASKLVARQTIRRRRPRHASASATAGLQTIGSDRIRRSTRRLAGRKFPVTPPPWLHASRYWARRECGSYLFKSSDDLEMHYCVDILGLSN